MTTRQRQPQHHYQQFAPSTTITPYRDDYRHHDPVRLEASSSSYLSGGNNNNNGHHGPLHSIDPSITNPTISNSTTDGTNMTGDDNDHDEYSDLLKKKQFPNGNNHRIMNMMLHPFGYRNNNNNDISSPSGSPGGSGRIPRSTTDDNGLRCLSALSNCCHYCCVTTLDETQNVAFMGGAIGYTTAQTNQQQQQHDFYLRNGSNPNNATNAASATNQTVYYYQDYFNDLSYSCTFGTSDDNGIWLNQLDLAGTIMSCLVWFLIGYSALTMVLLAQIRGIPIWCSCVYTTLASLALSSHVKTTLTDPGSVPASAVPTEHHRQLLQQYYHHNTNKMLSMCSQCQSYKPPLSHHCRICNRCISRMDHHCPWMNNCIGAGNMKHFLLFLIYTWLCSVYSLCLMGYNYFFCVETIIDNANNYDYSFYSYHNYHTCSFNIVLTQLIRIMTLLSIGSFLFTSSMLMNVVYGIMTGIGTIDRLKKKATGTMSDSDEESIPLKHIFGIGPFYSWLLPIDPYYEDYDIVMGYATPQRYLREQMNNNQNNNNQDIMINKNTHHKKSSSKQQQQQKTTTHHNNDPYYYGDVSQQQNQHQHLMANSKDTFSYIGGAV